MNALWDRIAFIFRILYDEKIIWMGSSSCFRKKKSGVRIQNGCHFYSPTKRLKSYILNLKPSSAFLQKVINVFDIIERIVNKKIEFRDGSDLVFDAVAQSEPDFFFMFFYAIQKLLFFGFPEEAEVNFGKEKIGRHMNLGNGNHIARE